MNQPLDQRDEPIAPPKKNPATTITWGNLLWPLVLAAYGVYRLTGGGHASRGSMLWYGFLVIAGGGLALLGLFAKTFASPEKGAKDIDNLNRRFYSGVHERQLVDESTIRSYRLDLNYYRQATESLQELGFRELGDYVILDLQKAMPASRAVVRAFLHRDGTVMGAIYDVRFRGWMRLLQMFGVLPRDLRTMEFETEMNDGTFVTTSNATLAGKTSEFPGVSRRFFKDLPPAQLLAAHRTHLQSRALSTSDARPVVLHSLDDLFASQDRLQMLKSRHRSSAAFNPAEQLERIAGGSLTPEQQELARQVSQLHEERVRQEGGQSDEESRG